DEGSESEESQADYGEGQVDPEVNRSVDMIINKFKEGLEEEDIVEAQGLQVDELLVKTDAKSVSKRAGTPSVLSKGSKEGSGNQNDQAETPLPLVEAQ
ncbi:hypothetical protein L195_g061691, partial [Trifolium pratense]